MPFINIHESPFAPDRTDVQLSYRETGKGIPLVFLHGGWGYEIYPFDKQIEAFQDEFRILIPDRSGYGRSSRIESLGADFHQNAAVEMNRFLDALNIDKAFLWGHSDGSVIAVKMAMLAPERFSGIILEAFHYYKFKPASHGFFQTMMQDPSQLGERVIKVLAEDHGNDYWRQIIELNGTAWLKIAEASLHQKEDLYGGRLSQLQPNTIFIHGRQDPRTEPDELEMVQKQLPNVHIHLIEEGKHSPHSERLVASETVRIASQFLSQVNSR